MKQHVFTPEIANEVYSILVEVCQAPEWMREAFVHEFIQPEHTHEWRFCGNLGFGGKLWDTNGKLYVDCYSEHRTPEAIRIIEEANKRLAPIEVATRG
jgi:hypothetical protein